MKKLPLHPAIVMAPIGVAFLIGVIGGAFRVVFFPTLFLFSLPVNIGWVVLQSIFLYQMWELAQASDLRIRRPTPGRAIGFWFIPFFGLYWTFILWRNLALHLNHMTVRSKVPVELTIVGCGLFIAGLFSALNPTTPAARLTSAVTDVLGFAGVVIFLIINFYFYGAAREIHELSGERQSGRGEEVSNG